MTVFLPEAVNAFGTSALAVGTTAPADFDAPSLATDIAFASTGLNGSCYVFGTIEMTKSVNKGTGPRFMCTRNQDEEFGTTTNTIGDITMVWDPQADDTEDVNALKALLADDAYLYFYVRRGITAETQDFAADDKVEIRHVQVTAGRPGVTGDGEFDKHAWVVSARQIGETRFGTLVA